MEYTDTLFKLSEDKILNYGENVRKLIDVIARVQGAINIEDNKVFGKHIHAFCWAFYTGVNLGKKETPETWPFAGFTLGTFYRDQAAIAGDGMLLIAIGELETENLEESFTSDRGIRKILNIISSYAEGGAKYILEIRDTEGTTNYLDSPYHFFDEINKRGKNEK